MSVSERWDFALRAVLVACLGGGLVLPLSALAIGDTRSLAIVSGELLIAYIPFLACAVLALVSPFIHTLRRHGPLLDSLTALFGVVFLVILAIVAAFAGLGLAVIFLFLFVFLLPFFWSISLTAQAGLWVIGIAFILAVVQMVRSNRQRKQVSHEGNPSDTP